LLLFVVAFLTLGCGYNDKDCSGDINVDEENDENEDDHDT
jgi:hypothetical protein